MLTVNELRVKHWSNRRTLWPRTSMACSVPFEGILNRKALMVAQDEAHDAVMYRQCGDVRNADKHWNRANYFLTGAYVATNGYWEQF